MHRKRANQSCNCCTRRSSIIIPCGITILLLHKTIPLSGANVPCKQNVAVTQIAFDCLETKPCVPCTVPPDGGMQTSPPGLLGSLWFHPAASGLDTTAGRYEQKHDVTVRRRGAMMGTSSASQTSAHGPGRRLFRGKRAYRQRKTMISRSATLQRLHTAGSSAGDRRRSSVMAGVLYGSKNRVPKNAAQLRKA